MADLIEQRQAEVALRASEEKYRTLFESVDEGFCIMELILDEHGRIADIIYREANVAFENHTGLKDVVGKRACELFTHIEQNWLDAARRVHQTGAAVRVEDYHAVINRWITTQYSSVGGAGSPFIAAVFNDITERKRRELNTAFLDEIGKDLSVLSLPDDIMRAVGERLGTFLQASACIFADVDEARNEATIHHGWNSTDVPSLKQTFRLADYFGEEFRRAGRAGETVIVRDTARDERADAEAYARLKLGGFVTVPFQRQGRWTANITVTTREPRDWRVDEIALLEEIASRVFPRIERARAEQALRESEEKYRTLFNSIDEGYYLCNVIFDENDQPIDIFYLDANPAATRMVGQNYTGRRLREIDPTYEEYWYDIFGRVAVTDEAVRMQQYAAPDKCWYDFYVFKVGEPESRRVAVVFQPSAQSARVPRR